MSNQTTEFDESAELNAGCENAMDVPGAVLPTDPLSHLSRDTLMKLASIDASTLERIIAQEENQSNLEKLELNEGKNSLCTQLDLKIKAFAPSVYDGRDIDKSEDYLLDIQSCIRDRKLEDHNEDCITLFGMYLTSTAKKWYNDLCLSSAFSGANRSYTNLVTLFTRRFTSPQRVQDAYIGLSRVQLDTPLTQHCNNFLNSLNHYNNICEKTSVLSSAQAVSLFMGTLNEKHYRQIQSWGIRCLNTTVEAIQDELIATQAEENQLEMWRSQAAMNRRNMNLLFAKSLKRPMTNDELVKYGRNTKIPRKEFRCNRCGGYGHKSIDCPTRTGFDIDYPKPVICTFCKIKGHSVEKCFKKNPDLKKKKSKSEVIAPIVGKFPETTLFKAKINNRFEYVVVDSLCSVCVITEKMRLKLNLKCLRNENPINLILGDNSVFQNAGKFKTNLVKMIIDNHVEEISFFIVPQCVVPIILGRDWLIRHNPSIDYRTNSLYFSDPYCFNNCFLEDKSNCAQGVNLNELTGFEDKVITGSIDLTIPNEGNEKHFLVATKRVENKMYNSAILSRDRIISSTNDVKTEFKESGNQFNNLVSADGELFLLTVKSASADVAIDEIPNLLLAPINIGVREPNPLTEDELKLLPEAYHDLVAVFSKIESEKLPAHRPYDIAINLIDGSTPKWGPLYNLSDEELKVLKTYIDESLQKGHIRPSSSPCGAPVLFKIMC